MPAGRARRLWTQAQPRAVRPAVSLAARFLLWFGAMLPNFLVIGAPRSGTTWIDKNLREHPQVLMSKEKEPHFFDRDYDKGIEYYEAFFSEWDGQPAVGEATPDYLHGAYSRYDVPALIERHLPGARLIASLRNPVERAYSRFWNAKARYDHNRSMSFEEKLRERPEFLQEGMYYRQLQRYYSLFPRENILVLLYDDLLADPGAFMHRIYSFIGVRADFRSGWEPVKVNQAFGKRNLARSRLLDFGSRALSRMRWHSLAERIRRFNSLEQPPMSPQTRRMLIETYAEENRRLQELIGRDLSHWNACGA